MYFLNSGNKTQIIKSIPIVFEAMKQGLDIKVIHWSAL